MDLKKTYTYLRIGCNPSIVIAKLCVMDGILLFCVLINIIVISCGEIPKGLTIQEAEKKGYFSIAKM